MTDQRKRLKLVVCFIERDGKILLPLKEAKIGAGRRNGVGGKVEEGESFADAAIREAREEAGIEVKSMREVGVLDATTPDFTGELRFYHVQAFEGEPVEQEGQGMTDFQWYDKNNLPFDKMWASDQLWYQYLLDGTSFIGSVEFDEEGKVIKHEIREKNDEFKVH